MIIYFIFLAAYDFRVSDRPPEFSETKICLSPSVTHTLKPVDYDFPKSIVFFVSVGFENFYEFFRTPIFHAHAKL